MSEDGLYDFLEKNFGRTVDRAACSAVADGSVPSSSPPPHSASIARVHASCARGARVARRRR